MGKYTRYSKQIAIAILCGALFVLIMTKARAEPYEHLKDYPYPLICKPYEIRDEIVFVGPEEEWIRLPWRDLFAITSKLLFRYRGGVIAACPPGYLKDQDG